jgi:hypothetical protein
VPGDAVRGVGAGQPAGINRAETDQVQRHRRRLAAQAERCVGKAGTEQGERFADRVLGVLSPLVLPDLNRDPVDPQ